MSKKEKGSVSTQSIMNIESITDYSLKILSISWQRKRI